MKKFIFAMSVIFLGCLLTGCEKKAKEGSSLEKAAMEAAETIPESPIIVEGQEATAATETLAENMPTATTALEEATATSYEQPSAENIQQALKNANLYAGNVDGIIGPRTKKAIRDFQTQNDLKVDGKVGPRTWQKLEPFLSQAQEEPSEAVSN